MTSAITEFIKLVNEYTDNHDKLPYSASVNVKIDEISGTLHMHIYRNEPKYRTEFSWKALGLKYSKMFYSIGIQEFEDKLKSMKFMKFYGDQLMTNEDFNFHMKYKKALQEIWNEEIDDCYICKEDTHGYKTICGHDICYKCYIKSIKHKNDNHDEHIPFFKCGVCRAIQYYSCACYDDETND